jgi:hypothetical protein
LRRDGRDRRWHVGYRRPLGEQRLHLGLRLARSRLDDLLVTRLGERVVQERNRGEREIAALDPHEQVWEATCQPGGVDAPARLVLGHAEPAHAELEHRRTGSFEMEAALFDLDEVREHAREHGATLATERRQILEELRVGEIGELHASVVHPEFPRPRPPRGKSHRGGNAFDHLTLAETRMRRNVGARAPSCKDLRAAERSGAQDRVKQNRLGPMVRVYSDSTCRRQGRGSDSWATSSGVPAVFLARRPSPQAVEGPVAVQAGYEFFPPPVS